MVARGLFEIYSIYRMTNDTTHAGSAVRHATFAAGCFWGVEAAFRRVPGVTDVVVGYTGGHTEEPTYEAVCTGATGHAEAVRVAYDPNVVSFEDLLETFWKTHDPTQRDGQGLDVGTQYRSAIFCETDNECMSAEASRDELARSGKLPQGRAIVTEIVAAGTFWPAEEYHQRYLEKHDRAVC